jgi:hypothetical protein
MYMPARLILGFQDRPMPELGFHKKKFLCLIDKLEIWGVCEYRSGCFLNYILLRNVSK